MNLIKLDILNIPEFLHSSEFYKNLNSENEIIIPTHCFIENPVINDINDLYQFIHTLEFWDSPDINLYYILYDFIYEHKSLLIDFIDQCNDNYDIQIFGILKICIECDFIPIKIIKKGVKDKKLFKWMIHKNIIKVSELKLDLNLFLYIIYSDKYDVNKYFPDNIVSEIFDNLFFSKNYLILEPLLNQIVKTGNIRLIKIMELCIVNYQFSFYDILFNIIIEPLNSDNEKTRECKNYLKEKLNVFSYVRHLWMGFRGPRGTTGPRGYSPYEYIDFNDSIGNDNYTISVKFDENFYIFYVILNSD